MLGFSDYYCMSCLKSPLLLTRVVCLDCSIMPGSGSEDAVFLMNLCNSCAYTHQNGLGTGVLHDNEKSWISSQSLHRLLQIRRTVPDMKMHELMKRKVSAWEERFATLGAESATNCVECSSSLCRPFWCCIECDDGEFSNLYLKIDI